ncbi:MAG: hypothetical protein E7438_05170 [Ruminococcaceae bacterium]|nr:hypothetical protein [Oscillospiraceae bacterium]
MFKRMICWYVSVILMTFLISGCDLTQVDREKAAQSIEVGMTRGEVHEILGEPDADLGSGIIIDMFILSDEHVATVGYETVDGTWTACHVAVLSFDAFKEELGNYPDDPNAWWN